MKQASPELVDFLAANRQFLTADLYTFNLIDGTFLRYTDADVPIVSGGHVFAANGPLIAGLKYKISVGLDVDEQTITIAAKPTDLVDGVPFLQALRKGVFDGCRLQRERAFLGDWTQAPVGSVILFSGRISTIDAIGRVEAQVKVKSDLVLLDIQMPRNTYQTGCIHTLFDPGCGLSKADFAVNGTVGGGSDVAQINWAGAAAGTFDQGTITFVSGSNAGVSRTVKQSTGMALVLAYPLDQAPGAGDAFVAYPGCDKTKSRCQDFFANQANFRGFPFTPVAETAY